MTQFIAKPSAVNQPRTAAQSVASDRAGVLFLNRARRLRLAVSTTPGLLRLSLVAIWMLAVVLAWVIWIAFDCHQHEMQTVGKDSAPSIIAAQSIKWNLADMHGNVIRQFLGTPAQAADAANVYHIRRTNVTDGLLAAAQNITYGDAERVPIRNLLNGLASYDEAVAQSRALHARQLKDDLVSLRQADTIMHDTLMPAADALDKANQDAMDRGYTQEQSAAGWSTVVVVLSSVVLIGGLVAVQMFLQRRMHRKLSPALVAAIILSVVWMLYVIGSFQDETSALKTAKKDCFDSISVMWRARADAADGQAELSLLLLDSASTGKAEHLFDRDSTNLSRNSEGVNFESLTDQVERNALPEAFGGYIATELRNITFSGEREAAVEMFRRYATYLAIATKLREANQRGEHSAAVELCLGDASDRARGAMTAFDAALGDVITINQREFDRAVEQGLLDVEGFGMWIVVVSLAIGLLAQFGVSRRLSEYNP